MIRCVEYAIRPDAYNRPDGTGYQQVLTDVGRTGTGSTIVAPGVEKANIDWSSMLKTDGTFDSSMPWYDSRATCFGWAYVKVGGQYYYAYFVGDGTPKSQNRMGSGTNYAMEFDVRCLSTYINLSLRPSSVDLAVGETTDVVIMVGDAPISPLTDNLAYGFDDWSLVDANNKNYSLELTGRNIGTTRLFVNYAGKSCEGTVTVRKKIYWKRLSGNSRYDTMAEIVKAEWGDGSSYGGWQIFVSAAVVARGDDFKDALAAAGLAGIYGGPIILTKPDSLSQQAREQLSNLDPQTVYVVGGPAAVSQRVLDQIKQVTGKKPVRVAGNNSPETSAKIATEFAYEWSDSTAILATNKTFKDALSMAPIAYKNHWPILLVSDGVRLNSKVVSALIDLGIEDVYIAGGTAAVSAGVESQIEKMGINVVRRFNGKTAVATSRLIADWALRNGFTANRMGYANSQDKYKGADALAGAAFCGKNGSVLLLCDDKSPSNVQFAIDNRGSIEYGYIFGGTAVFSDSLRSRLP